MGIPQKCDNIRLTHSPLPLNKFDMSERDLSIESRKLQGYVRWLACAQLSDRVSLQLLETHTEAATMRKARRKAYDRFSDAQSLRVLELCAATVEIEASKREDFRHEMDLQSLKTLEYYTVLAEAQRSQREALKIMSKCTGQGNTDSSINSVRAKTPEQKLLAKLPHTADTLPFKGCIAQLENAQSIRTQPHIPARSQEPDMLDTVASASVQQKSALSYSATHSIPKPQTEPADEYDNKRSGNTRSGTFDPVYQKHHKTSDSIRKLSESLHASNVIPRKSQEREQNMLVPEVIVGEDSNITRESETWVNIVVEDYDREKESEEMTAANQEQWEFMERVEDTL